MPRKKAAEKVSIEVTTDELALLCEALDSHVYWELSEENARRSGFVEDPGSGDPEVADEIAQTNALAARLEGMRKG